MTSFDEVIDLGLSQINDYRMKKLWEQGETEFKTYVDGFLITAIPLFNKCRQSLTYNATNRQFNADLTSSEISILSNLWVVCWYEKDNRTYSLYRQHLQNSGSFKNHSEAQNLKENSAYVDKLREELSRQLTAYEMEDLSVYM